MDSQTRTICWTPTWNAGQDSVGLEHLLLGKCEAESTILAIDEEHGPFRLAYRLDWDASWQLRNAELCVKTERFAGALRLETDGRGHWQYREGGTIGELEGCKDIDIWPTPFTNSFPIRRETMKVGERRVFRMAWIHALDLTFHAQPQAYTRISDSVYLFENLDGTGFRAELSVDDESIVLDYPELFRRVAWSR